MRVSIVGVRAFPADFVGTSGVEAAVEKTLEYLPQKKVHCTIYTRSAYQQKSVQQDTSVTVIPIWTVRQKIFETVVYSIMASAYASCDGSEWVWYQGLGPAIFSWIPTLFGKKIIVTVHSLDWMRKKWSVIERTLFYYAVVLSLSQANVVTAVSFQVQKNLASLLAVAARVTPYGFTPLHAPSKKVVARELHKHRLERVQYLLFIGRFVPEKRLEWLIRAFLLLQKRFPHLQLVIAGGQSYTSDYVTRLHATTQTPAVHWLPYVLGSEKYVLMKHAAAVVIPSELEGLPISSLEALSMHTPVVIADACMDEPLHKHSLVHIFQAESFASFFKSLLTVVLQKKKQPTAADTCFLSLYNWKKTASVYTQLMTKEKHVQ